VNHDPNKFITQFEKLNINIIDLVKNPDTSKTISQQAMRFFLVYNYFYFSRLTGKTAFYLETEHFSFRLLLKSGNSLPTYPVLKLFLSKMNYLFNIGNKIRFFEHIEEIHLLNEYSKELESRKPKVLGENKFQNSCIYGAKFYQLADSEQNSFNPTELNIVFNILMSISSSMSRSTADFTRYAADLKAKIAKLKENKSSDSRAERKLMLEDSLKDKITDHLAATVDFFAIIERIKCEEKVTVDDITETKTFYSNSRLQEKYYISVMNLIALINFKNRNYAVANIFLQKICKSFNGLQPNPNPEKLDRFSGLSTINNPLMFLSVNYNLFLSYYSTSQFHKAIEISTGLISCFGRNFRFWYIMGLCHYKIWQQEANATIKKELLERSKANKEVLRILDKRRVKLLVSSGQGAEACIQNSNLGAYKNFDSDQSSKHIVLAISYLENSLYLLQNYHSKEQLSAIFQPSAHRFKDYFNHVKTTVVQDIQKYLESILEHLTYMYLLVNKPMQALKIISISLSSLTLSPIERAKFATYHFKAALLLKKQAVLKTSLTDLDSVIQSTDKGEFKVFVGNRVQECNLPASFVLKHNRFLVNNKDKEGIRSSVQKLMDEYGRLTEQAKSTGESVIRNLLFHNFSKSELSRDHLRQVTDSSFELSKFAWNKNGKN
jgi:hypothetical protein